MSDVMTNGGPYRLADPMPPEQAAAPLTLEERMLEIRKRVGYVQKDAKNTGQGYSYASAEAVLNKVREAANDLGVFTSTNVALVQYQVDEGTTRCAVHMRLAFGLGGKVIVFEGVGGGQDRGDKAVMKASTAALKYALASGLLISWGDDPEADASTDKETTKRPAARRGRVPADPAKAEAKAAREEVSALLKAATTIEDLGAAKTLIQTRLTQGSDLYKEAVGEYTEAKTRIMSKETK